MKQTKQLVTSLVKSVHESLPDFKRRGTHLSLIGPELTLYIGFQDTKASSPDARRISADCGVYSPLLTRIYCGREFRAPDRITQPDCNVWVSLGTLAEERGAAVEDSWTLNPAWSSVHFDQAVREARLLATEYALPFLSQFKTLADLLAFLRDPSPKYGKEAWPRLRKSNSIVLLTYTGILEAHLESVESGIAQLERAIRLTKIDGAKEDLSKVRDRLIALHAQ